ncbi:MAG TPA: IS4 family transposase [Streptosporangiaceae bacterium]|nr:IS4 family transposase [Streptosporangiaceae bacterium]
MAGRLSDWVSLGVLASWVDRDAVDDAVEAAGKAARRRGGKLPPQVMVYFVMALALFAEEDYEEVWARLTETLADWGGLGDDQAVVITGGIAQARQRLGEEPVRETFAQVAVPVATLDTAGAFLGTWRKMSIDGLERDVPDTAANAEAFGYPGTGKEGIRAAFPKVRAVTIAECASHAPVLAALGACVSKGSGEQSLARELYPRLEEGWLLIADRNFCNWQDWCTAADTGAALLWRVKPDLALVPLEFLTDGSYLSVLVNPKVKGVARHRILDAARAGEDLDPQKARYVRVVGYEVPDRAGDGKGELIALVTTVTDLRQAPAPALAAAYHGRWEHETGNAQLKTYLRGPGKVLRPKSPDMIRQEIWGYLLTRYAISALICTAATAAGIDPDRVKFKRAVRIIRRRVDDPAAFPP